MMPYAGPSGPSPHFHTHKRGAPVSMYSRNVRPRTTKARKRNRQVGFAKAKANPVKTVAKNYARSKLNYTLAKRALRLAKLVNNKTYGPLQRQIQTTGDIIKPVATKPFAFDMNDVAAGHQKMCQVFTPYNSGSVMVHTQFEPQVQAGISNLYNQWYKHEAAEVNGPVHKALYAVYEFDINAKVDDIYLRFDFLQSKTNTLYQNHDGKQLPMALLGMHNLANCPMTNKINSHYFKRWRRPIVMYLNSRGSYQNTSALSVVGDMFGQAMGGGADNDFIREFPATTPFRRRFKLFHKINKVIKELEPAQVEHHDLRDISTTNEASGAQYQGIFDGANLSASSFQNKKLLDQKWCVISCSDQNANPLLSDSVEVKISRFCVWRDLIAA